MTAAMDPVASLARYREIMRLVDTGEISDARALEMLAGDRAAVASTLPAPPEAPATPEVPEVDADDLRFDDLRCKPSALRARVLSLAKKLGLTPEMVARTGAIFDLLGDDERKTFLVLMADGYCLNVSGCGRPLRENEICHCENGE